MTTMTYTPGTRFASPQATRRRNVSVGMAMPAAAQSQGWLDRLAAWAERQPSHRHLGHWISLR